MATPDPGAAADVSQAREDVERIAREAFNARGRHLLGAGRHAEWDECSDATRNVWRSLVTELLHRDVIRVGRRPRKGPEPMVGQESLT